jgi:hypothetical protein
VINLLQIQIIGLAMKEILIYDIRGKLVLIASSNQDKCQIDVSKLQKGFYFITIVNEQKSIRTKFFKL